MEPGKGIASSPPPAQSRTHQALRRPPGRSMAWEGVFILSPALPPLYLPYLLNMAKFSCRSQLTLRGGKSARLG